jgi:hypothetical protein
LTAVASETYTVVDCVNGSSWAFPDRTMAMMCAAGVHVAGHEVEVVIVSERGDGAMVAEALQRLPGAVGAQVTPLGGFA